MNKASCTMNTAGMNVVAIDLDGILTDAVNGSDTVLVLLSEGVD